MSTSPGAHPTYSADQLERYYDRIALSSHYRDLLKETTSIGKGPNALHVLSGLQKYHVTNIPFENLDLHYSFHHRSPVAPEDVFEKIVDRNMGRGGWCLQMNCLFGTVLRSLGFEIFTTAGRVSTAIVDTMMGTATVPSYNPINHMVNIVTIDSQRHLVDVGFGGGGPTFPIPLTPNYSAVNVAPQTIRLLQSPIPDFSDQSLLMWCYQYCNAPDEAEPTWTPTYCFAEMEYLPTDFAVINHYLTTQPSSFWLRVVIAMKRVMNENENIIGEVSLVGTSVKRRIAGRSEVLATFENDKDRAEALKAHLGVSLTLAEQGGIIGLQTELI